MRKITIILVALLTVTLLLIGISAIVKAKSAVVQTPLDFSLENIDGDLSNLSEYKGKVIMMVNVASKCGLTPQYEALQALYNRYSGRGFVVLGFPANNFRDQEPGTNAEIKEFCTSNYGVSFPIFSQFYQISTL